MRGPEHANGEAAQELLCPSAPCEEGATLLGIVGAGGVIGYITPRTTVDSAFVQEVRRGRQPEKRFRFAQPCWEGRCAQWTGSRCGLIERAVQSPHTASAAGEGAGLPACAIRRRCRWFAQAGAQACHRCPSVVTDVGGDEGPRPPAPPA